MTAVTAMRRTLRRAVDSPEPHSSQALRASLATTRCAAQVPIARRASYATALGVGCGVGLLRVGHRLGPDVPWSVRNRAGRVRFRVRGQGGPSGRFASVTDGDALDAMAEQFGAEEQRANEDLSDGYWRAKAKPPALTVNVGTGEKTAPSGTLGDEDVAVLEDRWRRASREEAF
jgi:hypothetical protein